MSSKRRSLGLHFMSKKKKQELSELFDSFKNMDGKVPRTKIEEIMQSVGLDPRQTDLKNVSEFVSYEEFASLMRPTLSNPIRSTTKQKELFEAFQAFDRDHDGVINAKELATMMGELGDKISEEEAAKVIKDVDVDNDGVVNFEEFSRMMGAHAPASPSHARNTRAETPTSPRCHQHGTSLRRFFCVHKH